MLASRTDGLQTYTCRLIPSSHSFLEVPLLVTGLALPVLDLPRADEQGWGVLGRPAPNFSRTFLWSWSVEQKLGQDPGGGCGRAIAEGAFSANAFC